MFFSLVVWERVQVVEVGIVVGLLELAVMGFLLVVKGVVVVICLLWEFRLPPSRGTPLHVLNYVCTLAYFEFLIETR